jgi:hypothetical protein
MTMERSDNTNRIKLAVRTSFKGLLSAGPAGLSAGLLAAGKASQTVFTVRLRDGRSFTALAAAADFADIHAAQVDAGRAERAHPADAVIQRYLAERYGPSRPAEAAIPVTTPVAVQAVAADKPAPAPSGSPATFGRRRSRPA